MAFGEVLFDEHLVSPRQPYLFNGKELDFETGLYYYGARYYDPKMSIFLNVDPLVEKTMSPYAYTYNNPINLIDPTGMEAEDWIKRGNQIFYDENVKSQADAEKAYGKNVEYLGNGAKLTTSKNGKTISEYTFYSDGTYKDMRGNKMDNTKNVTTAGGTTIFAYCSTCLNPGTLYQNPISLIGLSYPGGNNPRAYNGEFSYEYIPELLSEYPAIGHDRRYDKLKIEGLSGLLMDTRAIGADWQFVMEELNIALNSKATTKDRAYATGLGIGLGLIALPKTIFKIKTSKSTSNAILNILNDYQKSNRGNVNNKPDKR